MKVVNINFLDLSEFEKSESCFGSPKRTIEKVSLKLNLNLFLGEPGADGLVESFIDVPSDPRESNPDD